MRVLGILALVLLLLAGAMIGALVFNQRRLIYPGASIPSPWSAQPADVEAITIGTADGERLHGLWRAPRPGCGVVLSFHGNGSRPEPHAERFSQGPWRAAGWGLLTLAYRGYPGSTGQPSEEGLIEDGRAALRTVESRAPGAPVLLHGHSLGTGVAVAVAEQATPVGLFLDAPFDSLLHLVRLRFPLLPAGLLLRDPWRSDLRIARGEAPVWIVQGDADPVVPAKLAAGLARAAGARARLEVIPGDHVSILGMRDQAVEAFFRGRIGAACVPEPAALSHR